MIRKAAEKDIRSIVKIYDAILKNEEAGRSSIGWVRGIYPTEETAREALEEKALFVYEKDGRIVAVAKIDQEQTPEYAECSWKYKAPDSKVMVLHTLAVDPAYARMGCGRKFVDFFEQYALENKCPYLRMDTNRTNTVAWEMYKKLGYREAGVIQCVFEAERAIHLVCFEKKLPG
ncbi:MAG: GNAT family N-acetyltransferase [Lachnospiraceae bacterium]|nr:GNAT family N-acetyltransferase [Lachnospiraceae bacterium]